MQRRELESVRVGDVLGRSVVDADGRTLLRAGTMLTHAYLDGLSRRGFYAVYVRDGLADDVAPQEVISQRVRSSVTQHVGEAFSQVAAVAAERGRGQGSTEQAIDDLGEQPLPVPDADGMIGALCSGVEDLLDELLESSTVEGLESIKTHNRYTFEHSVDVAVVGALLGARLGMPRPRLRELALGCLLHDIGKTYIDVGILDKPGRLTEEEFAAVKEHPRMGFELVRRMPIASLLPAHVAYQHHERQLGGGYPRGLVGTNGIGARLCAERPGSRQMLLIAEIGAVADVHSALSSDRPYRPALPPDVVAAELDAMAGNHLNAQLVEVLRALLPPYPVGRWVEVTAGPQRGHRGVVTEVHAGAVARPTVRLLLDDRGGELAEPDMLDLRRCPEVELRCSDPEPVLV